MTTSAGPNTWQGNRLCFRRPGASGEMTVTAEDVEIRVRISILLNPLHTRIEREIVRLCDEHLGRANPPRRAGPSVVAGVRRSSRPA